MTSHALPPEVLSLVEQIPPEDVILPLLREALPSVRVQTKIQDDQAFPFLLVRQNGSYGVWDGHEKHFDSCTLSIHAFTQGLNDDEDAALLSEAVRVALRDSVNKVVPGKGYLTKVRLLYRARRVSDWATATGPVQYADLPTGVTRYESVFYLEIRRPSQKPFS